MWVGNTAITRPREAEGDEVQVRRAQTARNPGLVVIFPRAVEEAATVFEVADAKSIGRSIEAGIQLADATVSRRHASVSPAPGGFLVSDLGSSHGTRVDGNAVGASPRHLGYDSLLSVGETLLLACRDVAQHRGPLRRFSAEFLGLRRDIWAGPGLGATLELASRAASLKEPVLILGETGSGKEAVARLLHALRPKPGPFVAINVAAVPDQLFESELFGHVRGAFTGAIHAKDGAFVEANGGVLFLDEVADLDPDLQVKLLRALDQLRVRPVGARNEIAVDLRVITATSRDIVGMCEDGRFRADLYYRLSGAVLKTPPLRERKDEIMALASLALARSAPQLRLGIRAAEALGLGHWSGNVRELEHAIAQAALAALSRNGHEVQVGDLPEQLQKPPRVDEPITPERLREVMSSVGGNALQAAKRLGVSRATLYVWFRRHDLSPRDLREK
jgi:transcriptional regulator of acetoin/glycerol metabolism